MKIKKKANLGSLLRLLDFLWKNYKLSLIVSFILIILSSLATVNVIASIQSLVDVYVVPMLWTALVLLDKGWFDLFDRGPCQLWLYLDYGDHFTRLA